MHPYRAPDRAKMGSCILYLGVSGYREYVVFSIDPALVSGGLGFKARLMAVRWLLFLFTYLAKIVATPQP